MDAKQLVSACIAEYVMFYKRAIRGDQFGQWNRGARHILVHAVMVAYDYPDTPAGEAAATEWLAEEVQERLASMD